MLTVTIACYIVLIACPRILAEHCDLTPFGCCSDGVIAAQGPNFFGCGNPRDVSEDTESLTVAPNTDAMLACELGGPNDLEWIFVNAETHLEISIQDLDQNKFKISSEDRASVLSIRGLQPSDSGSYICRVRNGSLDQQTHVNLVIKDDNTESEITADLGIPMMTETTYMFITITPSFSCQDTSFGCCPDNITAAERQDQIGCPLIVNQLIDPPSDILISVIDSNSTGPGQVEVIVEWRPPQARAIVDQYSVYFTDDLSRMIDDWNFFSTDVTYVYMIISNHTTTYYRLRAFNSLSKGPYSSTFSLNPSTDMVSRELTGCSSSRFGCCPDGYTAALGSDTLGCSSLIKPTLLPSNPRNAENKEGATQIMVYARTRHSEAPVKLKVVREAVAGNRVRVVLTWEKPEGVMYDDDVEFVIRQAVNGSLDTENMYGTTHCTFSVVLPHPSLVYFSVLVTSAAHRTLPRDAVQSNLVRFNTEDESGQTVDCDETGHCIPTPPLCEDFDFGCCADGSTTKLDPDGFNCPDTPTDCTMSEWGCCSDAVNKAYGPDMIGCTTDVQPCDISEFGCCLDGVTQAMGPNFENCAQPIDQVVSMFDCTQTEFGCCPDGMEPAIGLNNQGCKHLEELAATCGLPANIGPCTNNYTVNWYFDMNQAGKCRRFWYGGCEGNTNRFSSQEHCQSVCVSPPGRAVCYLPAVSGRCNQIVRRWHYDHEEKRCHQFTYGGCDGNNNRFETEEDCMTFCREDSDNDHDVCNQPLIMGPCGGQYRRWWFNRHTSECEEFTYGGCLGNMNRFVSLTECQRSCMNTIEDVCAMPKRIGPCRSLVPSWHFDSQSGKCQSFFYGGCDGNLNRFPSKAACQIKCLRTDEFLFNQEACLEPHISVSQSETGCTQNERVVYSYIPDINDCREYIMSECSQTSNSFHDRISCQASCAPSYLIPGEDACRMKSDPGPCSGSFTRWFYDSDSASCIEFNYGGCRGNQNNFLTERDCVTSCYSRSSLPEDVCTLPLNPGNCAGSHSAYYYDALRTEKCLNFSYSGCGGNVNIFKSIEACEDRCAKRPFPGSKDEICYLAADAGPCSERLIRYHYNQNTARCAPFDYGGCRGNFNNFVTYEDCQASCSRDVDVIQSKDSTMCYEQPEPGPCLSYIPRWYYNARDAACQQFIYGGCSGNLNRFISEEVCLTRCSGIGLQTSLLTTVVPGIDVAALHVCAMERDEGVACSTSPSTTRWFYDRREGSCQPFLYQGCGGDLNNFRDKDECAEVCNVDVICRLPEETGNCYTSENQYRYDMETASCVRFVYSGCAGNANRFETRAMCEIACQRYMQHTSVIDRQRNHRTPEICEQPMRSGRCLSQILSYYYDSHSGSCREFVYTGCQGNDNRFATIRECRMRCMEDRAEGTPAPCIDAVCYNRCPAGYERDEVGCLTCKCQDPCSQTTCLEGMSCQLEEVECQEFDLDCQPFIALCMESIKEREEEASILRPVGVSSQFVVVSGSTVQLPCQARGNPDPAISWYKSRNLIVLDDGEGKYDLAVDGTLSIFAADANDGGEYICRAYNGIGEGAYEYLTVTVQSGVIIEPGQVRYTTTRGANVTLRCSVTGNPEPQVVWIRDGGEIQSENRNKYEVGEDNSLKILNVRPYDIGDYVCLAGNTINTASKTIVLDIEEPLLVSLADHDSMLTAGDLLLLTCIVQGFPPAKVEWTKNDESLPFDSRFVMDGVSLEIANVTEQDSGFYSCLASNRNSAQSITTTIEVKPAESAIPKSCQDKPEFANCKLILRYGYCVHPVYRSFCCRSCVLSGDLRTRR